MPLSPELKTQIINEIQLDTYFQKKDAALITAVVEVACSNNVRITLEHQMTKDILYKNIPVYRDFPESEISKIAQNIFYQINHAMANDKSASILANNGSYSLKPIHERERNAWLEDHDILHFMPKSIGNIDILAPMDRNLPIQNMISFLSPPLTNPNIQHLLFPLGLGHWRSIALTKPSANKPRYMLEIFDSFGKESAKIVQQYLLNILSQCGIPTKEIDVKLSTCVVPQKDTFSCGDFTCAYSHQKMLDFGAPAENVNIVLINALNTGNQDNNLRKTLLEISNAPAPAASKTTLATTPSNAPSPAVSETTLATTPSNAPALAVSETRLTKAPSNAPAPVASENKLALNNHIKELLAIKDSLFKSAQDAQKKQQSNQPLTDEELATILQVEEFKKAGYR